MPFIFRKDKLVVVILIGLYFDTTSAPERARMQRERELSLAGLQRIYEALNQSAKKELYDLALKWNFPRSQLQCSCKKVKLTPEEEGERCEHKLAFTSLCLSKGKKT